MSGGDGDGKNAGATKVPEKKKKEHEATTSKEVGGGWGVLRRLSSLWGGTGPTMVDGKKVYKAKLKNEAEPKFVDGRWIWPGEEDDAKDDPTSKPPPKMSIPTSQSNTSPAPSNGGLNALMAPPGASFLDSRKKTTTTNSGGGGLSSLMAPPGASFLHRSRKKTAAKKTPAKMPMTIFVPKTSQPKTPTEATDVADRSSVTDDAIADEKSSSSSPPMTTFAPADASQWTTPSDADAEGSSSSPPKTTFAPADASQWTTPTDTDPEGSSSLPPKTTFAPADASQWTTPTDTDPEGSSSSPPKTTFAPADVSRSSPSDTIDPYLTSNLTTNTAFHETTSYNRDSDTSIKDDETKMARLDTKAETNANLSWGVTESNSSSTATNNGFMFNDWNRASTSDNTTDASSNANVSWGCDEASSMSQATWGNVDAENEDIVGASGDGSLSTSGNTDTDTTTTTSTNILKADVEDVEFTGESERSAIDEVPVQDKGGEHAQDECETDADTKKVIDSADREAFVKPKLSKLSLVDDEAASVSKSISFDDIAAAYAIPSKHQLNTRSAPTTPSGGAPASFNTWSAPPSPSGFDDIGFNTWKEPPRPSRRKSAETAFNTSKPPKFMI